MKTCITCKKEKEPSYFPKHETNRDRLGGECKLCVKERKRRRDKGKQEAYVPPPPGYKKKCTRCKKEKDASHFSTHKSNEDGLQFHCKPCFAEDHLERYSDSKYREEQRVRVAQKRKLPEVKQQRAGYAHEYMPKWRENNKEWVSIYNRTHGQLPETKRSGHVNMMKNKYMLSEAEFEELLLSQLGCCKICNIPMDNKLLCCIDHCHVTKIVRGLLCHECNKGIARFYDSTVRLQAAIDYLSLPHTEYNYKRNLSRVRPLIYQELLDISGACCQICKTHSSEFKKKLAVDHSHETNKIRGVLCSMCNMGVGNFKDSPTLLASAIAYLQPPISSSIKAYYENFYGPQDELDLTLTFPYYAPYRNP